MPNIMLTIPDVTQSVFRPVIMDIVDQVKEITKIAHETPVYFYSDEGHAITPGSSISDKSTLPKFSSQRMVTIEVEQVTNLDNLATSVSNRSEHQPIIEDSQLKVIVRPIYESTDIRINFKYRTGSKQEAKRWKDDIAIRVSAMREMFLHSVHYHYGLPPQVWELLGEIHSKREMLAGYGETFPEYIQRLSKGRMTIIGEGTGTNTLPVVSEKESRIIGMFDFSPLPEKHEYEEESGTFLISFTYKLTYDCPVGCNVVYPIMVHNQYLNDHYIEDTTAYPRPDMVNKRYSESFYAFQGFETETTMNSLMPYDAYLRIPSIDDYKMPMTHAGTGTAILLLMKMDNPGPNQHLFHLDDLGDSQLDQHILQFIREVEYPYLNKLYRSIIHVSLLEGDMLCDPDRIAVDEVLSVTTTKEIDLRKLYHVRIALVTDLALLDPEALIRLSKYPKAFVVYFSSVNELLRNRADFQRLGDRPYISQAQVRLILKFICGIGDSSSWLDDTYRGGLFKDLEWRVVQQYAKRAITMKTVMLTGVIATKRN